MWKCIVKVWLVLVLNNVALTSNNQLGHRRLPSDTLSPSLVELEVVAILPTPSKRALSLSRTLSRTLNSITAADLVSQLDFPEKNLTWKVTNFFVTGSTNNKQDRPRYLQYQGHLSDNDDDSDIDIDEEEEEDEYVQMPLDAGTTSSQKGGKKGRRKVSFGPESVADLCEFLSMRKALSFVSLLPDHNQKILSLVTSTIHVPLIAHSSFATLKVNVYIYYDTVP